MPTLSVEVTADDIRLGKQGEPNTCAVARAVKRLLPPKVRASVKVTDDLIDFDGTDAYIDLPKKVVKFIDAFDADRKSVEPFNFRLRYKTQETQDAR